MVTKTPPPGRVSSRKAADSEEAGIGTSITTSGMSASSVGRTNSRTSSVEHNSHSDFITDEMVQGLVLMSIELSKRGIVSFIGGCGIYGYPELAVHQKLQDALQESGELTAKEIHRRILNR